MENREISTKIDDAAAVWVARLDRGALSDAEDARLRAWLAEDVRRMGAFARARAMMARTEIARALGTDYDPARFLDGPPALRPNGTGQQISRRRLLWLGGGMAACSMTAFSSQLAAHPRYQTRRGERLCVSLADGTVVNLNTMSEIEVDFSPRRRVVRMEGGEALFHVAKDAARPFVVLTGETSLEVVGTEFSVRRDLDSAMRVVVQEGVVKFVKPRSSPRPVTLTRNMRVETSSDGPDAIQVSMLDADVVERELYWRHGKIAFSGTTLAEAAQEFGRYNDRQIIIPDPQVGKRTVVGLFDADDPEGFATAVAGSFGLEAALDLHSIRLTSPLKRDKEDNQPIGKTP